jgi:nitric oxide reductase NorD protein
MARALTGNPIEIFPAEREGGYKNNNFFLPISFSEFPTIEENLTFYHFRILFLSVQQRLNLNWIAETTEPSLELSQLKELESSEVILPIIFKEFALDPQFVSNAKAHYLQNTLAKKETDFS